MAPLIPMLVVFTLNGAAVPVAGSERCGSATPAAVKATSRPTQGEVKAAPTKGVKAAPPRAKAVPPSGKGAKKPAPQKPKQVKAPPWKPGFAEKLLRATLAAVKQRYGGKIPQERTLVLRGLSRMLSTLAPGRHARRNRLYSPKRYALVRQDLGGKMSGVGIVIRYEASLSAAAVLEAMKGSPAAAAGMKRKDAILSVDGFSLKRSSLGRVVARIRGPVGTFVALTYLREGKLRTVTVQRKRIVLPQVRHARIGRFSYLRVKYFTRTVVAQVKQAIGKARKTGACGLVLDLRGNPGGLFSAVIEVAKTLVPQGAIIVRVKRRRTGETVYTSSDQPLWTGPVVVLVDRWTASAAEILAAAIRQNCRRAALVGQRTAGKGSIEAFFRLLDGYTAKLTIGYYRGPSNRSWDGKGLEPDVAIPSPRGKKARRSVRSQPDPGKDPALKAAVRILQLQVK